MNENPTPALKSYLAFSITKCPTDRCADCLGLYTNGIIGVRIVCTCQSCGHNKKKNNEEVQTYFD